MEFSKNNPLLQKKNDFMYFHYNMKIEILEQIRHKKLNIHIV